MKHAIILSVFVFSGIQLFGQGESANHSLSVGYYGHFLYEPGFKVATQHSVKEWQLNQTDKKNPVISQNLFVSPQLAVFWRPKSNTNLLLNADFGLKRHKMKRNRYSAFSIGLGYLMQSEILSTTISLSDGSTIDKDRELRHYFIPTVNYEFGHEPRSIVGWYFKLSLGGRFAHNRDRASVISGELGMKFKLSKKANE